MMMMPAEPNLVRAESVDAVREAGAVLTVDLAAIRANYRLLRDKAAPADCAAVVKADAYGLGAGAVAQALAREGCRSFFVAHRAEAEALSPLLSPKAALFVLNGFAPGTEDEAAAAPEIMPVLNSLEQARLWAAAGRRRNRALPAALHADTGLSRLGLPQGELAALRREAATLRWLDIRLLLSHLACADTPGHPANALQHAALEKAGHMFAGVPISFANSSGIFLGSAFHQQGVRAGAALYGVNPTPGRPNPMRQAVRLEARVIRVGELPAGAGVGYGHEFVALHPMRVAAVGLGYGDGWPRRARTAAFRGDARLPILGRVSMDSIVLDASCLPPGEPAPGDAVTFLGAQQTPDDLAAATGTIGYEILTSLGRRIVRRYIEGA